MALKCEQVPRIPPDFAAQTSPAPEVATVCAPGDWEGLPDGEADSQAARELLGSIDAECKRTAIVIPPLLALGDASLATKIGAVSYTHLTLPTSDLV